MRKDIIAREFTTELIVGSFVFLVLLAIAYFTIVIGYKRVFKQEYTYMVDFPNVKGLRKGDSVIVRGMPVGEVKDLHLTNAMVRATTKLSAKLELHEDYKATVVASSILGGNNLSIDEGSATMPILEGLTTLKGSAGYDLVTEASVLVAEIRDKLEKGALLENASRAVANLADMSDRIKKGEGSLGKLVNDPAAYNAVLAVASNLQAVSSSLAAGEGTIGKLLKDETIYNRLDKITADVASGKGSLGKIVSDDGAVYDDLKAALANIREVTEGLRKGEGTLGKMMTDNTLYTQVVGLVQEARSTVDDFRETSPILTFSSIFFGAF